MKIKITYQGQTRTYRGSFELPALSEVTSPERYEAMIREGEFTYDDGTPITGRPLQRLRERVLGTYANLPDKSYLGRRSSAQRRMLIPGFMPWGTIPMLGGNPKAGKTTIAVDFATALVMPGYRFLGHFEPAELTEEELGRGLLLINAETPPEDLEAPLDWLTEQKVAILDHHLPVSDLLGIEHLEDLGGAHMFDVTDPALYDLWANRLTECHDCDGMDDWTPFAVIVDGVTAILHAAGKGVEAYGEWYAAFRRLMREIDVPNALAIAHNTMAGSHLMGGVEAQAGPDALWTYSSDNADDPASTRRFSVRPRTGGVAVPPMRVVLNPEGRPVVDGKATGEAKPSVDLDGVAGVAALTAAYVREHPGADGQELTDNVDSGGLKPLNLQGRTKALENGWVREEKCTSACTRCSRPHHRRTHYWPVQSPTEAD
ncbi:MAG: AAA family ATPase [Streptosporangiales bacterium]|nr:AAA family ATPase [Streptosporangiales bacterium]